ELLLRIERNKNFFRRFQSGDDHFFGRDKSPAGPRIARQNILRGDVTATEVFAQKESDARVERAFIKPVHETHRAGSAHGARTFCTHRERGALKGLTITTTPPTSDPKPSFAARCL